MNSSRQITGQIRSAVTDALTEHVAIASLVELEQCLTALGFSHRLPTARHRTPALLAWCVLEYIEHSRACEYFNLTFSEYLPASDERQGSLL